MSSRSPKQRGLLIWLAAFCGVTAIVAPRCIDAQENDGSEPETQPQVLVVAADPENLPYSNRRGEGFENKLAELIAKELGLELRYEWRAQRRGFFRETLGEGRCDLVMGVPSGFAECTTTQPYYRSTYVFVAREDSPLAIKSLDDPALAGTRIGIQTVGDGHVTPPGNALARRGLSDNLVGYSLFEDYGRHPARSNIVDAVASHKVDLAAVWGPVAGYFAAQSGVGLTVTPIVPCPEGSDPPLEFDISMGVRRGNEALRERIERVLDERREEIEIILDDFHVPRLSLKEVSDEEVPKP